MRRTHGGIAALAAMILLVPSFGGAAAIAVDFESPAYSTGPVHGQDGWESLGSVGLGCAVYDVEVVDGTSYGVPGFGDQSLRISNAETSGCFGDQTFSKPIADQAGEADADAGGLSGGTRFAYFETEWEFASTVPGAEQPALSVVASPDRGDGARMSWIQMADTFEGLEVNFFDYQDGFNSTGCDGLNFVSTAVANRLDRSVPHTIKIAVYLLDGRANDVVQVFVDGSLAHTGTTWEDFFRDCQPVGGNAISRTIDSILFRVGGGCPGFCNPALAGKGFLIDNFAATASEIPTTMTATPAIADLAGPNLYLFTLNANLASGVGGIGGAAVTFSSGSTTLCTATTDAAGNASCSALLNAADVVLAGGYDATFAGDGTHAAASATAGLI